MKLNREQELRLFRNINSINKKWELKDSRISYIVSNRSKDLRNNQGKAKAKLIKFISKYDINFDYWLKEYD